MNDLEQLDQVDVESLVGRIADEFTDRLNRGECPDVEEYSQRYPQMAEILRQVLSSLQTLRSGGTGRATEGESPPDGGPVPERLGEFRILREIGRGGMGVVYEAVQESLGRHVALKVLPAQALANPTVLARFRREAQAAARLHHTNIVAVFAVGQQDGIHYYAMQYIEGQCLEQVVRRAAGLSLPVAELARVPAGRLATSGTGFTSATGSSTAPNETDSSSSTLSGTGTCISEDSADNYHRSVARIAVQVADALAHAHGHGVMHRDIKPSNLLLDSRGTVWVTDFGLAKQEGDDLTQTGDIVGTLRYMAPERFSGETTTLGDVYGLGATLYELLTLRPAFDAQDRGQLIKQITHEEPTSPRKIDRRIPRDLETIVLKAIEKEPSRRYQTAESLADDLQRFLAYLPIQARRVSPLERLGRWCSRNPLLAGAVAAVMLALTVGLLGTTWQWRRAENHLQQAEQQRGRAEANFVVAQQQRIQAEQSRNEADEQRQIAQREAERAEQYYGMARDAVNDFLVSVGDEPAFKQPALQPLRKELLTRAQAYYQSMIEMQVDDPQADADLAANHARIGRIKTIMGPITEAIEAYEKAVELFDKLTRAEPETMKHREELVSVLNSLAVLLQSNGRYDEARQCLDRAISVSEQVLRDHPDAVRIEDGLARSYNNRGWLASEAAPGNLRQRADAALEYHEKSLVIRQRRVRENPNSDMHAGSLAQTYGNMGNRMLDAGRPEQALELHEQTLAIRQDLARKQPKSVPALNALASAYTALGDVYRRFPKKFDDWFDRAVEYYDKAREIREKLAAENSTNLELLRDISRIHLALARMYRIHGDTAKALLWIERTIEERERWLQADPGNVEAHALLPAALREKGQILEQADRRDEAAPLYQRAIAAIDRVIEMAPQVKRYQDERRSCQANLARVQGAAAPTAGSDK